MSKSNSQWRIVEVYAVDGTAFLKAANGYRMTFTATDLEKLNTATLCHQPVQLTDLQGQDARLLSALANMRLA